MNLIDGHVTEVISVKEFEANAVWNLEEGDMLYGKVYTRFTVAYTDMGGTHTTYLDFEKGTEPDIKPGYVFQH